MNIGGGNTLACVRSVMVFSSTVRICCVCLFVYVCVLCVYYVYVMFTCGVFV